ncbi:MAG: RagB/SusD family nutrient uptake outer membrane protein [Flavobacteriales bacterium]|nr:MAG: RagB/SusD family nutrient uptake outer membrane protein [Flavobacteriales bacterium]
MKNKRIYTYLLFTSLMVTAFSCTDLKIKETDSIFIESSGGEFTGVADVESSLTNLYGGVRGQVESHETLYGLSEVSSDEMLIPTRGTDWGDNGIWRTLHQHTWGPTHLFILKTWNNFNQNVFLANEIIDARSNPTEQQAAEAKFLRAFNMWVIMDMFGQVPFREVDEGPDVNPKVLTRMEAFDFIMKDLDDAISILPSRAPGETNKAGKAAALFLKARMLLNKHIYNGTGTADASDMTEVINIVDLIAAEGHSLESGYFDIFKDLPDNETIWHTNSSTGNRIWSGLHYHQVTPTQTGGGWNGFSTLAEFYDSFEGPSDSNLKGEGQEERRGWVPDATTADDSNFGIGYGFLIGQQYDKEGTPLKDRAGAPLSFTKDFPGLVGNREYNGIRVLKYHPANGDFASHVIVFRYAEAHLMKAEALMRSGGDAKDLVNELRAIRGASALAAVTEEDMLAERGRELYQEMVRRTDLIRFGKFTDAWEFKEAASVGDETKTLFPIPTNALLSNPNLTQNPGY